MKVLHLHSNVHLYNIIINYFVPYCWLSMIGTSGHLYMNYVYNIILNIGMQSELHTCIRTYVRTYVHTYMYVRTYVHTGWGTKNCTCDCCLLYKLSAIFGSPPCTYVHTVSCKSLEPPPILTTLFLIKFFCKTIGSAINLEIKLTYSCTSYAFLS